MAFFVPVFFTFIYNRTVYDIMSKSIVIEISGYSRPRRPRPHQDWSKILIKCAMLELNRILKNSFKMKWTLYWVLHTNFFDWVLHWQGFKRIKIARNHWKKPKKKFRPNRSNLEGSPTIFEIIETFVEFQLISLMLHSRKMLIMRKPRETIEMLNPSLNFIQVLTWSILSSVCWCQRFLWKFKVQGTQIIILGLMLIYWLCVIKNIYFTNSSP